MYFKQDSRRGLGRLSIFILIVEQEINNGFTVFSQGKPSQLWVEKLDTEPDVVVLGAFAIPDVAIEIQELVIGHLGLIMVCNYTTCIHNLASQGHLGRSEHL